jgi:FlaA1/EpsC-like NDP-sugar epimerase
MMPRGSMHDSGPFEYVDCTHARQIQAAIQKHQVGTIFHLAALLSAVAEEKPHVAWDVNMGGLYRCWLGHMCRYARSVHISQPAHTRVADGRESDTTPCFGIRT